MVIADIHWTTGEGYLLRSSDANGGSGDPLGPTADKVDIIYDADKLLAMVGNWREFGAKIEPAEMLKEIGDWGKIKKALESADNVTDALQAMQDALELKPESKPTGQTPSSSGSKPAVDPVFKTPGKDVYRRAGGLKTEILDSTGKGQITTKPATDTFPAIKRNP